MAITQWETRKERSVTSYLNFSDVENKRVERYFGFHFTRILRNSSNSCSAELFATRLVILSVMLRSLRFLAGEAFVQICVGNAFLHLLSKLEAYLFCTLFHLIIFIRAVQCAFIFLAGLHGFDPRQHHNLNPITSGNHSRLDIQVST